MPLVNNILTWIPRLLLQAIAVTKWVEERILFFDWLFDALVCPRRPPSIPEPFEVPLLNTFQVAKGFVCLFIL